MADINIPKIGPVKKPVVIAIGVGAIGFIGWRYYQSRAGAGADVATTTDFADGGTIPSVDGAVSSDNSYGSGSTTDNSTTSYGFTGTTNDQWTQYATTQLSQSADWSYTDIVTALGNFITNKPLSTLQQQIVQAAIAVAGYPPVGSHTIIPVGDVPLTVAPSGVKAQGVSSSAITVSWSPLAGASSYEVFNGTSSVYTGTATSATISGLVAAHNYTFYVAGRNMAGATGPKSSGASAFTFMTAVPANVPRTTAPVHMAPPTASGTTAIQNHF